MLTHEQANTSAASKKLQFLQKRALMLKKARQFFEERKVMEVDCPILSASASVDAHIDLIACTACNEKRFLHSSPEYGMKRLLALGSGDIYQLSHVFRDSEHGVRHNPEFMMAEWYRCGLSLEALMEETCQFISLFVGDLPRQYISYQELFLQHTGLDPFSVSCEALLEFCAKQGVEAPFDPRHNTKDDLLSFIVATCIDPHLGRGCLTVVPYFPPSQAALAQVRTVAGHLVAERFEVFCEGLELANGYHELQNPSEQRRRFEEANQLRLQLGKEMLPIDERFLYALEQGLPDCSGVAVGFDRLMQLHCHASSIAEVIAWDWSVS